MNPFMGFSSASSGAHAGLPYNQSRQIGHPPKPDTADQKECKQTAAFGKQGCAKFGFTHSEHYHYSTLGKICIHEN